MKSIVLYALLSGPGAGVLLLLLARMIPNEKLFGLCFAIGKLVTSKGESKLGKAFWKPVEDFIDNSIKVCCNGFVAGMESDDQKEVRDVKPG